MSHYQMRTLHELTKSSITTSITNDFFTRIDQKIYHVKQRLLFTFSIWDLCFYSRQLYDTK